MAGALIFPRGVGMFQEIGDACDNLHAPPDQPVVVGCFDDGQGVGSARVLIALALPQGQWLTTEISLSLLLTAADAFVNLHGDPRSSDTCLRCGTRRSCR